MSGDGDRPERERPSWREIDQRRDRARRPREAEPRGPAERARSRAATRQALKEAGALFSSAPGGAAGERLARAVREARGTPELAAACRAYRGALGLPRDASLLSLFLDSGDSELVVAAIEALGAGAPAGGPELTAGQRSQLRILAQGRDDAVAEAAEALLQRLGG
jgi:hypothetical protein